MLPKTPIKAERPRDRHRHAFQRILIAVDESDTSVAAVQTGGRLAKEISAEVALIHVIDTSTGFMPELEFTVETLLDESRPAAEELLDRVQCLIGSDAKPRRVIRTGGPWLEITKFAHEWQADLIIVGTHGRGRLARMLIGSTAEAVLQRASCPVLVINPRYAHSWGDDASIRCKCATSNRPNHRGSV